MARAADVAAVATVSAVAFAVNPVAAEVLASPCAVSAAAVAAVAAVLAVALVSPDEVFVEDESDASVAAVAAEVALVFVASDKLPAVAAEHENFMTIEHHLGPMLPSAQQLLKYWHAHACWCQKYRFERQRCKCRRTLPEL